ncbi:MAG: DUF3108 domain-containing protein [Acidobacteriota bacterium]
MKRVSCLKILILSGLMVLAEAVEFRRPTPPFGSPIAVQARSGSLASVLPFAVGETLTYNVSWKIFDAGVATMSLVGRTRHQNSEVYHVSATARSTGLLSTLFKVLDVFESYFGVRDLCSRRLTKNIQEGRRSREILLNFDQAAHVARLEDRDLTKPAQAPKRTESPIPPCVQDVISALYTIRTKNLKVGEPVYFPINDGGKTYDVQVEVQIAETIKTPAGSFPTLRLEPKVFDGLFKKKGRMFVWVTNDSQKIPVQLRAKIAIGTITAALTRHDRPPQMQAAPDSGTN